MDSLWLLYLKHTGVDPLTDNPTKRWLTGIRARKFANVIHQYLGVRHLQGEQQQPPCYSIAEWWLNQPIWNISVKVEHLPKVRVEKEKKQNIPTFPWNWQDIAPENWWLKNWEE